MSVSNPQSDKTVEEVVAAALVKVADDAADLDGFDVSWRDLERDDLIATILAALSAAGLVVCGDGEANIGGVRVRVEQPSDYDGDGECWPYWIDGGVNTCVMRHLVNVKPTEDPLYRLVPLDEGTGT